MTHPNATHWHYHIVRHESGNLSLCEVYFDENNNVVDIVENPLFAAFAPAGEGKEHIIKALKNALRDAQKRPILDE